MSTDPLSSALAAVVSEAVAPLAQEVAELRRKVSAPQAPPALLDRKALARELGTSLATVDRLRSDGMPEVRLVDAPRFELGAVLGWLRTRGQP